ENVSWNFDVDGARLAGVTHRTCDHLIELTHDLLRYACGARRTGYRPQDVYVRYVLQWPHVGLRTWRTSADQHDRCARERGIRNGSHRIGDAWSGRHHRDTKLTSQFSVGMRHMDGRAFIANIYYANAFPSDVIPDWLNMTSLKTKNAINATGL